MFFSKKNKSFINNFKYLLITFITLITINKCKPNHTSTPNSKTLNKNITKQVNSNTNTQTQTINGSQIKNENLTNEEKVEVYKKKISSGLKKQIKTLTGVRKFTKDRINDVEKRILAKQQGKFKKTATGNRIFIKLNEASGDDISKELEELRELKELDKQVEKQLNQYIKLSKDLLKSSNSNIDLSKVENKIREIVLEKIDSKVKSINRRLNKLLPDSDEGDDQKLPLGIRIKRLNKRKETLEGYLENSNFKMSKTKKPAELEKDIDTKIEKEKKKLEAFIDSLNYKFTLDEFQKELNFDKSYGSFIKAWEKLIKDINATILKKNYSALNGMLFNLRSFRTEAGNKLSDLKIKLKDEKEVKPKTEEEISKEVSTVKLTLETNIGKFLLEFKQINRKLNPKENKKITIKLIKDLQKKIKTKLKQIKIIDYLPEDINEKLKDLNKPIPKTSEEIKSQDTTSISEQDTNEDYKDYLENAIDLIDNLIKKTTKKIKIKQFQQIKLEFENLNKNDSLEKMKEIEIIKNITKQLYKIPQTEIEQFYITKIGNLKIEFFLNQMIQFSKILKSKKGGDKFVELEKILLQYNKKDKRELKKLIDFGTNYSKYFDELKKSVSNIEKYDITSMFEEIKKMQNETNKKPKLVQNKEVSKEDIKEEALKLEKYIKTIIDILQPIISKDKDIVKKNEEEIKKQVKEKNEQLLEEYKIKVASKAKGKARYEYLNKYYELVKNIILYGNIKSKKQDTEDALAEYEIKFKKLTKEIEELNTDIKKEVNLCNDIGIYDGTTGRCNVKS